jgi:hypothetical protein
MTAARIWKNSPTTMVAGILASRAGAVALALRIARRRRMEQN